MNLSSVAWVPDDDSQRDWNVAAGLAARWVDDRCNEEEASGVLVTNTLDHLGVPELEDFERRHSRTSRLASADRVGSGRGPVLSYVPRAEELQFAMDLARDSSLAVVETISFPLSGWAAWFEAWNLVDDQPTPPLPEAIKKAVDRLKFYGNNGFTDQLGKKQARSIVSDLLPSSEFDINFLPGAVLAAGVPARGVKNLRTLVGSGT